MARSPLPRSPPAAAATCCPTARSAAPGSGAVISLASDLSAAASPYGEISVVNIVAGGTGYTGTPTLCDRRWCAARQRPNDALSPVRGSPTLSAQGSCLLLAAITISNRAGSTITTRPTANIDHREGGQSGRHEHAARSTSRSVIGGIVHDHLLGQHGHHADGDYRPVQHRHRRHDHLHLRRRHVRRRRGRHHAGHWRHGEPWLRRLHRPTPCLRWQPCCAVKLQRQHGRAALQLRRARPDPGRRCDQRHDLHQRSEPHSLLGVGKQRPHGVDQRRRLPDQE